MLIQYLLALLRLQFLLHLQKGLQTSQNHREFGLYQRGLGFNFAVSQGGVLAPLLYKLH